MSDHLTIRRPGNRAPVGPRRPAATAPDRAVADRGRSLESVVFALATLVALAHGLDDAFVHPQPGVGSDHVVAAALATLLAVGGMIAFPRSRPGVRAAIAGTFGALAVTNGAMHVIHIGLEGPERSDLTGVLAALAGLVLLALAAAIPFRHRGEGARTAGRRWVNRVLGVVGAVVLVVGMVLPVAGGIAQTHKYREPIGEPPDPAYQEVSFASSDGLELSGWYRPSRNRAAVVLVHGGGGDRMGIRAHARLLAGHGYGVLLYDSRGRGDSEGSPNSAGWGWEKDVEGALSFLADRPEVDGGRLGGLGLSTGADVLLEVATYRRDLRAVVSDGATGRSFEDLAPGSGIDLKAWFWMLYATERVISGSEPGPPLRELVPRISPTPLLLISAGRGLSERKFNTIYAGVAREPVEFWDLPDVNHTAAIRERADEYERRVVSLFDRALVDRG